MGWFLIAGLLTGCGYQFVVGGPGPIIGGEVSRDRLGRTQADAPRLAIETIRNDTFEPNLGIKYTEYLRREFAAGSGAEVVTHAHAADFVLEGFIGSVSFPALSFTPTGTFENRAIVTVTVTVRDQRTQQLAWKQKTSGASEFFVTNDLQFNLVLQRRAIEQAGEHIAGDLAARFLVFLEALPPPKAASSVSPGRKDSSSTTLPSAGREIGRPYGRPIRP